MKIIVKLFVLVFSVAFASNVIAQTVYTTKSGEKYHKNSCRYLKYSKKETTIKKAKNLGYLACKVCKPISQNTKVRSSSNSNSFTNQSTVTSSRKTVASRCIGKTKSGSRCKRKTKKSNGRCYQH